MSTTMLLCIIRELTKELAADKAEVGHFHTASQSFPVQFVDKKLLSNWETSTSRNIMPSTSRTAVTGLRALVFDETKSTVMLVNCHVM